MLTRSLVPALRRRITVVARQYSIEDRYKEKLLQKAKAEGVESIEELKKRLADQIEEKKKELNKIDPLRELEQHLNAGSRIHTNKEHKTTKMSNKSNEKSGNVLPKDKPYKTLDDYLKLDKIKDLSKQEVEFLWRAKWSNRDDSLVAVVPYVKTFQSMYKYAVKNPLFVLPLPRENAADGNKADKDSVPVELQYVQWQFAGPNTVHCLITSLAEYKLHQDFAKPHTTIQFHLDLANDKDMVLMNGQVESDSNVSLQDAQLLLLNVQRFYGAMGSETSIAKERIQLLEDFNKGSQNFDINKLIQLAQSMEN
ncbi:ATP11 protein [Nakaseomyces glabratus]